MLAAHEMKIIKTVFKPKKEKASDGWKDNLHNDSGIIQRREMFLTGEAPDIGIRHTFWDSNFYIVTKFRIQKVGNFLTSIYY